MRKLALVSLIVFAAAALLATPTYAASRAKLKEIPAIEGTTGGAQLFNPDGIASNISGAGGVAAGDFYVADRGNQRVVEYSAEGTFVRTFGLGVNQTTGGNICTAASGDTCKNGTSSPAAGSIATPIAIAVDQGTGNVYVYGNPNKRVDVFSATGQFEGAFGWKVKAGAEAAEALQFCTTAGTGCQAGTSTSAAGGFLDQAEIRTFAVDPSSGNIYAPDPGNARYNVYSPSLNGSNEVTGVSFVHSVGWDVIPSGQPGDTGTGLETCTEATTCKAGTVGNGAGQFLQNNPISVSIDTNGYRYLVNARNGQGCTAALPCRVQKFNPDDTFKEDFGPASGPCQLTYTNGINGSTQAAMAVTVDPSNNHVFVLKKTGSTTYRACEFDSAGNELGISPGGDLLGSTGFRQGIAVGPGERLYVTNGVPAVYILAPVPAPEAQILPVTEVGQTSAKLNGKVTVPPPGGEGFNTIYHFEVSVDGGVHWTKVPASDVSVGSTAGTFEVHQVASGLQPNSNYVARLVAATGPSVTTGQVSFSTLGAPPIVFERNAAKGVTPTSGRLAGTVNPSNSTTSYRFEYGTTTNYGSQSPAEFEPFLGSGGQALPVSANLTGLEPHTTYHWRIVATNATGTTKGPDHQFTTYRLPEPLNAAGLAYDRGIELVSPPDKRPVGTIEMLAPNALFFQVADSGDRLGYLVANGVEGSPGGGEFIYAGSRSEEGWSSTGITSPSLVPSPVVSGNHTNGRTGNVRYLDPTGLKCGLVETFNPLSEDTPEVDVENGVYNLYRWNAADDTYTLVTNRIPLNPNATEETSGIYYQVLGASADCSRIFFRSAAYVFPGGTSGLYEWHEGTLRDAGVRPDGTFGAVDPRIGQVRNAVSRNGRLFFMGTSSEGADAGKKAVFVRKDPAEVVDASQPTSGPTLGAFYETASPDGSHVFFIANYGIAATSSSGPSENCSQMPPFSLGGGACDLYDYNVDTGQLTDISANSNPANTKGAVVEGVLDVSEDGSTVYFAARGQLVPGEGRTYAQNLQGDGFANVYRYHAGELTYVGGLTGSDFSTSVLIRSNGPARTNKDGTYLLYLSSDDMTGTNPAGVRSAYLFSAATGASECISCPADGSPPHSRASIGVPGPSPGFANVFNRSLGEGGRAVFSSEDVLAPGAIEGHGEEVGTILVKDKVQTNLYEWHEGQISLLATGRVGLIGVGGPDGRDVFIRTFEQLDPRDFDFSADIYDFRSGGGFAPPLAPPVPCDPAASQCQGTPTQAPGVSSAATSGFAGPGNVPASPAKARHKKKKKKKRAHKHKAKRHERQAKSNRGGAK